MSPRKDSRQSGDEKGEDEARPCHACVDHDDVPFEAHLRLRQSVPRDEDEEGELSVQIEACGRSEVMLKGDARRSVNTAGIAVSRKADPPYRGVLGAAAPCRLLGGCGGAPWSEMYSFAMSSRELWSRGSARRR